MSAPDSVTDARDPPPQKATPPPVHVSMTPPPSSQLPAQPASSIARTPTPQSHLSSPPPTLKPLTTSHTPASHELYPPETVATATADELRNMLASVATAHREAKTAAASLKLQYNLLLMEKTEALNRKDVELDMALKEVQVARARDTSTPTLSAANLHSAQLANAQAQYAANLQARIAALEADNNMLLKRYDELRTVTRDNESALLDENARLRDRIRANRKHVNLLRASSAAASDGAPSPFSTPARKTDAFSQLLLADQVLSQEASAPTTPAPRGARRGHARAVHSLSSLPATPTPHSVPARSRAVYYTPTHVRTRSPPAPQTAPPARTHRPVNTRRRESRDSTISAAEDVGEEDLTDRDDGVPESQASREAARMLSASRSHSSIGAGASFGPHDQPRAVGAGQRGDGVARSSGLLQAKLYGAVSRPGSSDARGKRKASSELPVEGKKARGDGAVGLGIGGWASSPPAR